MHSYTLHLVYLKAAAAAAHSQARLNMKRNKRVLPIQDTICPIRSLPPGHAMSGNYAEPYSVLCCETDARAEGLRTCMRMRHGITYLLPPSLSLSACMYVCTASIHTSLRILQMQKKPTRVRLLYGVRYTVYVYSGYVLIFPCLD